MERRALLASLSAVGLSSLAGCTSSIPNAEALPTDERVNPDWPYPDGAGPNYIDFSTLQSDNNTVLHTPRTYWDSYAIVYTEPHDCRRVEGNYYIDSSTGAVISDLWYGAKDYRKGPTYAYVQLAEQIPDDRQREELESDPAFVYDNATNAYYRYDRHYGEVAPTNIGRHTELLSYYGWEATNSGTHHGVSVITYQLADSEPNDSRVSPAVKGTLQLGADQGIIYAFDITLTTDEGEVDYTYRVRPAAFPDHNWIEIAQSVAARNSTARKSTDSK